MSKKPVFIIGFTGTREGLNEHQKASIKKRLVDYSQRFSVVVHHGDCTGADEEFHKLCKQVSEEIKICIHPPVKPDLRAYCAGEQVQKIYPEKDYLARDRDIVNVCDVLIGCPKTLKQQGRSGTWYTIGYAQRVGKPILVINPFKSQEINFDKIKNREN